MMLFNNFYGVDLGSNTVRIYSGLKNQTFTDRNIVAARGHEIIACGDEAYEIMGKEPAEIMVKSPMSSGMIAELELQEIVLFRMLEEHGMMTPLVRNFCFAVPSGMTAVEKRAYYYVVNGHWLRQNRVYMVERPFADALSLGIQIEKNVGTAIVNIGGDCTEFSVIADGKIIMSKKIGVGGRRINEGICNEIHRRYHLQIGIRTAERLKLALGRLSDQKKEARKIVGIDSVSGLPKEEAVSSYDVNAGIMDSVNELAAEMKTFLERMPPQITYHIAKEGIYLTGGSSRLPYLDHYLASYTGYTFNLSDKFENSSLNGIERIIRERDLRKWTQIVQERKL